MRSNRNGVAIAVLSIHFCLLTQSNSHITTSRNLATDDGRFATEDDYHVRNETRGDNDDNEPASKGRSNNEGTDDVEDEGNDNEDFPAKNLGSVVHLDNRKDDGSIFDDEEAPEGTVTRLQGMTPTDNPRNFMAQYNPVLDAFCFNEDYPIPKLSSSQQYRLYRDYKKAFDKIKVPTTDVSEDGVTFDRIPGMFLRMCFHDNTINVEEKDFQKYVASAINPDTMKWRAETRYMKTSGADASNLICPEERFHPNNNLDQTASRVLKSIQTKLKKKYPHISYADLLHNGCNAATIYLTDQNPEKALDVNPFTFGRKDACHVNKEDDSKYPLCGPSELLPGVDLSAKDATNWFTSRGMSACLFMGLMWTHTTVAIMGTLCPLTRLTCTTSSADVSTFPDPTLLYFQPNDKLDYFNFFLKPGTHETFPDPVDVDDLLCKWSVDGKEVPWPMTAIDCTLGLDGVKSNGPKSLAKVIKNFAHNRDYNREDILQCALKVLGGTGGIEGGACDMVVPRECKPDPDHKFGGFYSTSDWQVTMKSN